MTSLDVECSRCTERHGRTTYHSPYACWTSMEMINEIERLRTALSDLLEAIDRENKPPYPVLPLEIYERACAALTDHDQS